MKKQVVHESSFLVSFNASNWFPILLLISVAQWERTMDLVVLWKTTNDSVFFEIQIWAPSSSRTVEWCLHNPYPSFHLRFETTGLLPLPLLYLNIDCRTLSFPLLLSGMNASFWCPASLHSGILGECWNLREGTLLQWSLKYFSKAPEYVLIAVVPV